MRLSQSIEKEKILGRRVRKHGVKKSGDFGLFFFLADVKKKCRAVRREESSVIQTEMRKFFHYEEAKKQIFTQLVGKERYQQMLAEVPHREIEDMAVIYRGLISVEEGQYRQLSCDRSDLFVLRDFTGAVS